MIQPMQHLWAPWRMEFIKGPKPSGCFFCEAAAADPSRDAEHLVLARTPAALAMLNRYPYNNGHLMVAPKAHLANLEDLPPLSANEVTALTQRALEVYVTVGRYQAHVRRSCQVYRRRRDAIIHAIGRDLPDGVQVVSPQGGLFVWLRLPEGVSATRLLPLAAEEGVEYAPGPRFFPQPADGERYLRLNFATQTPAGPRAATSARSGSNPKRGSPRVYL